MLVTVHLDGVMGKEFGQKWKLSASTPAEILSIIEANTGRLSNWLRQNADKYSKYRVHVTYKNGKRAYLGKNSFFSAHNIKSVRFAPVIEGAGGGTFQTVVGVALMVSAIWLGPIAFQAGLALTLNGITQLLAPKQKAGSTATSHYFQGVGKNQMQGNPVPLIYGRCKVEGVAISKRLTTDEEKVS